MNIYKLEGIIKKTKNHINKVYIQKSYLTDQTE